MNKIDTNSEEAWEELHNLSPDAYEKAMQTRKAFGMDDDERQAINDDYPEFFDFAFTWKWKLILSGVCIGMFAVVTFIISYCVQFIWSLIKMLI